MECSPPGSSVHGILQARILEWVAISFSRGSSQPRDQTQVSRTAGRRFNLWATREAPLYIYVYVYTHTGKFHLGIFQGCALSYDIRRLKCQAPTVCQLLSSMLVTHLGGRWELVKLLFSYILSRQRINKGQVSCVRWWDAAEKQGNTQPCRGGQGQLQFHLETSLMRSSWAKT